MGDHQALLKDREVLDRDGVRIGKVSDVLFDESSELSPSWLVVNPGAFRAEHFVPADGAVTTDEQTLRVPYDIDTVRSSPKAPSDHVVPSAAKVVLRDHYHLPNR